MATTNAQIAAELLREAAAFYRTIGVSSPDLKDRMDEFGVLYEQVADRLASDPIGALANDPPA